MDRRRTTRYLGAAILLALLAATAAVNLPRQGVFEWSGPSSVTLDSERNPPASAGADTSGEGPRSAGAVLDSRGEIIRVPPACLSEPYDCDPGPAYRFHANRSSFMTRSRPYPISVSGTTITVDLDVRAGQAEFDLIAGWIQDYWQGRFEHLGEGYTIAVNLTLLDNPFARAHMEIRHVRAIEGGWCGSWSTRGGINADTLLLVAWGGNCFDVQAVAAAHEFGHELGFRDAYDAATCEPLHEQSEDIMTCAGLGRSVLGAHARILVEQYGRN